MTSIRPKAKFHLFTSSIDLDKFGEYESIETFGVEDWLILPKVTTDNLESIRTFYARHSGKWIFFKIGFEAFHFLENIDISANNELDAPMFTIIVPQFVFTTKKNTIKPEIILQNIEQINAPLNSLNTDKTNYLKQFDFLQRQIQHGNLYEINFCRHLSFLFHHIDGFKIISEINTLLKPPFGAYVQIDQFELFCASPERFMCKKGNLIVCQPMKGTNARKSDKEKNELQKQNLKYSQKERSENIMIVDLVRNDLARICEAGSVEVTELCGVYEFPNVNQMISTIQGKLTQDIDLLDALKALFPMGSMTGAPKISSLELIAKTENDQRGLYSGSIGYINPMGDWDFNVVIRTIIINHEKKVAKISAGGAITALSNADDEFDETILKIQKLTEILNAASKDN